jgi:hypothetical protein
VFGFSLQLSSETILILRRNERNMIKIYIGLHVKYSCQILIKREFSRQISEKYSNITFRKNHLNGSRVVPRGEMDGQTDMKLIVIFLQVCERV